MSSSWIKTLLKYALLLTPAAVLTGLIALIATGGWVTSILRDPARFSDAPKVVQMMTRAVYWHTRKHWHTVPECVQFDSELLYRPRPGECVFENAEFRTVMHFDERGARRTPVPAPSSADTSPKPRLVIVGDSHAMGWGVDDHETFASVLASEHGYTTVNLAVSSYGTPRELMRLRRDFTLAPEDVVIIQYCDNDFAENQQFATSTSIGPYRREDLQHLFDYRPAEVAVFPVAGVLLRLTWQDLMRPFTNRVSRADDGPDATTSLLRVLAAFTELQHRRVIIVAVNGPGAGTHLDPSKLSAAGFPLLIPELAREEFLDIDDHMRPQGHAVVAVEIARVLQ